MRFQNGKKRKSKDSQVSVGRVREHSMYKRDPAAPYGIPYYCSTYVKEGGRVKNGYINQNCFTSMLWVRGGVGMIENLSTSVISH